MQFNPTALEVSKAIKSPYLAVKDNWPLILQALNTFHVTKDSGRIAALATISVEARCFQPIKEYGGDKYFHRMYDITSPDADRRAVATRLGNTAPGDGIRYCGRGFVQTTGKNNYDVLGKAIGIDLLAHPDELLKPTNGALALAHYFRTHGVDVWAEKAFTGLSVCSFCDDKGLTKVDGRLRRPLKTEIVCKLCGWMMVRRCVNGGLNGYPEFKSSVDNLLKLVR